jgi:hypothetical protein
VTTDANLAGENDAIADARTPGHPDLCAYQGVFAYDA